MIIPGFSAYSITEDGVVTHIASGNTVRRYKACSSKHYPYMRVSLIGDDGRHHTCNVLRLLALAYLEKPDIPCVARAKDGDNLNIALSNVEWAPYAKSTMEAWKHGRYAGRKTRESLCATSDSMELVLNTLEQLDSVITTAELSRLLDVPYSTVRYSLRVLAQQGKVNKVAGKGFTLA